MAQAYEFGLEGQNLFVLGGSAMRHEQTPDLTNSNVIDLDQVAESEQPQSVTSSEVDEGNTEAKVLRFQRAVHHADIIGEALKDLAEVVPLDKARSAVNEAFGLGQAQLQDESTTSVFLPPTGTANEITLTPTVEEVQQ